jgi:hypothetical protein
MKGSGIGYFKVISHYFGGGIEGPVGLHRYFEAGIRIRNLPNSY